MPFILLLAGLSTGYGQKRKVGGNSSVIEAVPVDEHKKIYGVPIISSPLPLLLSWSYFGVIPHIRIEYSDNGVNKVAMLDAMSPQLKNFNWWSLGTAILCHCPSPLQYCCPHLGLLADNSLGTYREACSKGLEPWTHSHLFLILITLFLF